jgi:hypothetical protein
MKRLIYLIILFLTSCGPKSLEDFREEGRGVTRSLIQELQVIQTRQELLQVQSRLQKLFDNLVTIMTNGREFQEKYSKQESLELTKEDHEISEELRIQLQRIYYIDGGKEIIEKCQEQALQRLDAFEKRLARKRLAL